MSKYEKPTSFLENIPTSSRRMRFDEIEDVLGSELPRSARSYAPWWANDPRPGRQCHAWLRAGFVTEQVDVGGEAVTFRREGSVSVAKRTQSRGRRTSRAADRFAIETLPDAPGGEVDVAVAMQWKHLGRLTLDKGGKLGFPQVPAIPALYRIRLVGSAGTRHYVGETADLRRRFGNYRNPDPTQATSMRISDVLVSHLRAGDSVEVDLTTDLTLSIDGQPVEFDLAKKATRRLLEQAAIVAENAIDIESLNR